MRLLLLLISILLLGTPVFADTVTYYFNAYDSGGEEWSYDPELMVDGDEGTAAQADFWDSEIELLTSNTCVGTDLGTITKVELRAKNYCTKVYGTGDLALYLRPVFSGTDDGDDYNIGVDSFLSLTWCDYVDITSDDNAPASWGWPDIQNLDCEARKVNDPGVGFFVEISKVEIRVTYTEASAGATITPGAKQITIAGISPTVNITGGSKIYGATLYGATIYGGQ